MDHSSAEFETTRWTLILSRPDSPAVLEELAAIYAPPVYAFFRRRGYQGHDARDLTQAFFADVFLGRDLVARADPIRGRFRSFLLTALHRYNVDAVRRRRAADRLNVPLDADRLALGEAAGPDEDATFDRDWSRTVCHRALATLEAELRERGRPEHLAVFERRFLWPLVRGTERPSLAELCEELGIDDPSRVSNILHSVKRRFEAILRRVIAQTVEGNRDLESEFTYLTNLLHGRPRAGRGSEPAG